VDEGQALLPLPAEYDGLLERAYALAGEMLQAGRATFDVAVYLPANGGARSVFQPAVVVQYVAGRFQAARCGIITGRGFHEVPDGC
jgi:hypothetical protein